MWLEPLKYKALAILYCRSNPIFSVRNAVFMRFSGTWIDYSNQSVTN